MPEELYTEPLLQNQIMTDVICTSLQNMRADLKKAFFQQNCSTINTIFHILSSTFMVLFTHINILAILVTNKLFSLCKWAHSQFLGISWFSQKFLYSPHEVLTRYNAAMHCYKVQS